MGSPRAPGRPICGALSACSAPATEANLARQRFMQAHPDNRMVADVLEAEWNAKLRALDEAQHELERGRAEHRARDWRTGAGN